jgi:hypothetical protein
LRGVDPDHEHFYRLILLFAVGVVLFLGVRALLVPAGFGQYGHFRPGALADSMAKPSSYAGRAACAECHDDVADKKGQGKHAGLGCEACHGPLVAHARAPEAKTPELPDPQALCARCHAQNQAKPAGFPQVDPAEHAGDASCADCHDPHSPAID